MWRTLVGAGVLTIKDDKVLMVLRERSGKTRWELPSGLVEAGESLEEAAVRETLEETAISVTIGSLLCTVVMDVPNEKYRAVNVYYCASILKDKMPRSQSNEPIVKAEYVNVASLRARDIHPVDRRIISRWKNLTSHKPFYFRIVL